MRKSTRMPIMLVHLNLKEQNKSKSYCKSNQMARAIKSHWKRKTESKWKVWSSSTKSLWKAKTIRLHRTFKGCSSTILFNKAMVGIPNHLQTRRPLENNRRKTNIRTLKNSWSHKMHPSMRMRKPPKCFKAKRTNLNKNCWTSPIYLAVRCHRKDNPFRWMRCAEVKNWPPAKVAVVPQDKVNRMIGTAATMNSEINMISNRCLMINHWAKKKKSS